MEQRLQQTEQLAILSMLLYTAKAENYELVEPNQFDTNIYNYYPDRWRFDVLWWFILAMFTSYALGVLTGGCVVKLCCRNSAEVPTPVGVAYPHAPVPRDASESAPEGASEARARTAGVQGPVTYPWWHKQPRYTPLPERRWGVWWEA